MNRIDTFALSHSVSEYVISSPLAYQPERRRSPHSDRPETSLSLGLNNVRDLRSLHWASSAPGIERFFVELSFSLFL